MKCYSQLILVVLLEANWIFNPVVAGLIKRAEQSLPICAVCVPAVPSTILIAHLDFC